MGGRAALIVGLARGQRQRSGSDVTCEGKVANVYGWMRRAMARPVLWAAVAGLGLVLGIPAASATAGTATTGPAARFASEATAYQNAMIERVLSRVPGGTRISPSEARWPEGITFGVTTSSQQQSTLDTCLEQYGYVFCGFEDTEYNAGDDEEYWVALQGATSSAYWDSYGAAGYGMQSWYNATPFRVWREQAMNRGNELCIDPQGAGNYADSDYYNGADVNDYWVLMTINFNNC